MSTLSELLSLLSKGVLSLSQDRAYFAMVLVAAFVLAGLSWYLCNNYVKLWNRRFRLTATHQILTIIASILTFFFVLAFGGLKYMQEVSNAIVMMWEGYEIKADTEWNQATFKEAYYKVKDLKSEDFSRTSAPENGGSFIPTSKKVSQEAMAKVYAIAACSHFDEEHPFLSKIIWSDSEQPTDNVASDVVSYFENNPNSTYTVDKAVTIAADTIKTQLREQTPRTVTLSRIGLVILYLLVMAIPLGLIGYAAYKDIRIQK